MSNVLPVPGSAATGPTDGDESMAGAGLSGRSLRGLPRRERVVIRGTQRLEVLLVGLPQPIDRNRDLPSVRSPQTDIAAGLLDQRGTDLKTPRSILPKPDGMILSGCRQRDNATSYETYSTRRVKGIRMGNLRKFKRP
jgi:hypothetical protein